MTSQTLSEIYNYAAFSYEYYNAATQTPHGQVNQQHMTDLQPDTTFYGKVSVVFLNHFKLMYCDLESARSHKELSGFFTDMRCKGRRQRS